MEKQKDVNPELDEKTGSEIMSDVDEAMEAEVAEATIGDDKYKRLAADFANYKKRVEASWSNFEEKVEDRVLYEMLTIYDDFVRLDADVQDPAHQQALNEGVKMVQEKWQQWLKKFKIETIDPEGREFNHNLHDAVSYVPVDSPELHDKVVQVVQKGYRRGERILRHAHVVLGRYVEPERADGREKADNES